MKFVLTPEERRALAYAAEVFRGTALRLRFTWPADSQSYTDQAKVIESLLARAGAEQEKEL
jgi:hypothetical protein